MCTQDFLGNSVLFDAVHTPHPLDIPATPKKFEKYFTPKRLGKRTQRKQPQFKRRKIMDINREKSVLPMPGVVSYYKSLSGFLFYDC